MHSCYVEKENYSFKNTAKLPLEIDYVWYDKQSFGLFHSVKKQCGMEEKQERLSFRISVPC